MKWINQPSNQDKFVTVGFASLCHKGHLETDPVWTALAQQGLLQENFSHRSEHSYTGLARLCGKPGVMLAIAARSVVVSSKQGLTAVRRKLI